MHDACGRRDQVPLYSYRRCVHLRVVPLLAITGQHDTRVLRYFASRCCSQPHKRIQANHITLVVEGGGSCSERGLGMHLVEPGRLGPAWVQPWESGAGVRIE